MHIIMLSVTLFVSCMIKGHGGDRNKGEEIKQSEEAEVEENEEDLTI